MESRPVEPRRGGILVLPRFHHQSAPSLPTHQSAPPTLPAAGNVLAGVPRTAKQRMLLDATLAPAVLDLRYNRQNILNEMNLRQGKVLLTQLPQLRPRPQPSRPAPTSLPPLPPRLAAKMGAKAFVSAVAGIGPNSLRGGRFLGNRPHTKDKKLDSAAEWWGHYPDKLLRASRKSFACRSDEDDEAAELLEDPRIVLVFRALQHSDGTGLPRHCSSRTLTAFGHLNPDQQLLEDTLKTIPGDGPLKLVEFAKVLAAFNRDRRHTLQARFNQLDTKSIGTISTRDLRQVLRECGFAMTPEAVTSLLAECGVQDRIDWAHFLEVITLAHERFGFSREEVQEYESLFDRYDYDRSGDMSADEFASALGWLGHPTSIEQATQAIMKFDLDGNLRLCKPEFLLAVRQVRDEEVDKVRELFSEQDTDGDGIVSSDDLRVLLEKLGYTVSPEVVEEGIKASRSHARGLFFEEALHLLQRVRQQEGFSDQEAEELMQIFRRFDTLGKGRLRPFELARVLSWLGFPISQRRQLQLWCRLDVDKSGTLEPQEFLKLFRLLREEEALLAKLLLTEKERPTEQDFKDFLVKMGYAPPQAVLQDALRIFSVSAGDGAPELGSVLRLLRFIRESQVAKLRQNEGLTDWQVAKIQSKFGRRFSSGKLVELGELEKLILILFPADVNDPEAKPRLQCYLQDNFGETGVKSIEDVYRVVRLYSEHRDEELWLKEAEAIAVLGFSPAEVAQLREAFVAADLDGDGVLTAREVGVLLLSITSNLRPEQAEWLRGELSKIDRGVEFTEFLRIVKTLARAGSDHSKKSVLFSLR